MSFFLKKSPVKKTSLQSKTAYKPKIFQSYKYLIGKLEEESSQNKLVIENIQNHLKAMEGLDRSLSQMMQDFWVAYSPTMQEWLYYIKQILGEFPGKIKTLKENMERCETPALKAKYQKLLDIQHERESRWKTLGAMITSKILALKNIDAEIEDIQNKKLISTNSLNKILQDYKAYEKDVKETLKDYRIIEDFENRVQKDLDKAISDISPLLLDLVNNKILENIKSIVPRGEFLLAGITSIESLSEVVGSKVEELNSKQGKIIKAFQKLEIQSLEFKLKLEPINGNSSNNQLESKFDEVIDLLSSVKGQPLPLTEPQGTSLALSGEDQKKTDFEKYQEIVKEMGKSKTALEEIYALLDNEANDFSGIQLKKIMKDFPWDLGIRNRISRHPQVDDKTLQLIIILELRDQVVLPHFLALLISFSRLVLHIVRNDQYFQSGDYPRLLGSSIYQNKTAFFCFQKYVARSKISRELFTLISESKKEKVICSVLKNPLLDRKCFFDYKHTENQSYINALATNAKTPAQVLNNLVKNANGQNRELIFEHPNATSFTKELIGSDSLPPDHRQ